LKNVCVLYALLDLRLDQAHQRPELSSFAPGPQSIHRVCSFRSHGPHSEMQSKCSISAAFVQSIDLSCSICAAEMQEICSMNAVEVQYQRADAEASAMKTLFGRL